MSKLYSIFREDFNLLKKGEMKNRKKEISPCRTGTVSLAITFQSNTWVVSGFQPSMGPNNLLKH